MFLDSDAETLVSVVKLPHIYNPKNLHRITLRGLEPYTDSSDIPEPPPVYARNGPAILINKPAVIARGEKFGHPMMPYVMPPNASIDIDEPLDLEIAALLLNRRLVSR